MKPLLLLEVPVKTTSGGAAMGHAHYLHIIGLLKNKLLPNYEVIVAPYQCGCDPEININTEGMVKLTIDATTNFDELFNRLDGIVKLRDTADELKNIGKQHPNIITDALGAAGITPIGLNLRSLGVFEKKKKGSGNDASSQ